MTRFLTARACALLLAAGATLTATATALTHQARKEATQ